MNELKATLDRIAAEKMELEIKVEENLNQLKQSKEETDQQINQLKSNSEEATCKLLKVQEKEKAHMKHRLELASKLSSALNDVRNEQRKVQDLKEENETLVMQIDSFKSKFSNENFTIPETTISESNIMLPGNLNKSSYKYTTYLHQFDV